MIKAKMEEAFKPRKVQKAFVQLFKSRKDGLISETFSFWLKSPKKMALSWAYSPLVDSAQEGYFALFFEIWA